MTERTMIVAMDSDEDDASSIYNPDGRMGNPLPYYWIFKLHVLNYVHLCEICGNKSLSRPA